MMKAEDIMTTEVITIRGSATVAEAVDLMKYKGLRSLVVEPRTENDPYGMVTETDIVYKVAAYGKDSKQVRVYEIMTKPCIVVNPELGVEYVARLFANTRIRRAPVIKGKLLGIISITDILRKSDLFDNPKPIFIEDEIEAAREEARRICAVKGDTSRECAAAWDIVEELLAVASDQRLVKEMTES
ncbi:MAG: CBS domain-containing protein [Sphaerospermopsis sp.]|uniref:CP12 polypeptide n=3 Tax=Sphaerospermopsis TaxID=752201 RepID=A0A479ZVZ1_9CYAN|nr:MULTISPECIES: CBS domain-containing protein [Sphaerospermopsis]MEB3148444.1 CBS domain-containing protein [Sphaerospermopsis sp.]MBC5793968.1 CBS domain-containing protein [Sphaerospermopsis sp. LEGE 00249]MBD2134917.1 CBS domain-containing protein [Sphaerospermopsis sp. FACHB-1094]MBD2145147.1 CBS domain-containing protein [Sphaerospermopsis sp. FACHB-1194]MBE9234907.1 CBS domain-containing protein [Sphaerospermopsis aphanizomenoides LEGE 00250]